MNGLASRDAVKDAQNGFVNASVQSSAMLTAVWSENGG